MPVVGGIEHQRLERARQVIAREFFHTSIGSTLMDRSNLDDLLALKTTVDSKG